MGFKYSHELAHLGVQFLHPNGVKIQLYAPFKVKSQYDLSSLELLEADKQLRRDPTETEHLQGDSTSNLIVKSWVLEASSRLPITRAAETRKTLLEVRSALRGIIELKSL